MRYLLDTNVVVALLKRQPNVTERVFQNKRQDYALSSVVAHELLFGAYCSRRADEALAAFDGLRLPILDFTIGDARRAGQVRAALAAAGTPIGPYDVLIAGQALARDLMLITRNTREFARVEGLRMEDWEGDTPTPARAAPSET